MIAASSTAQSFFRRLQEGGADFDGERFLTEVDALFGSEALLGEVRWRLEVLHELAQQRGMEAEFEVLRDRLTQIFATSLDEAEVTRQVKALTQIDTKGGSLLDLRRFLVAEPRLYNENEYREVLARKISNTALHVTNLSAFYPDEKGHLRHLDKLLGGLSGKIMDPTVRTRTLKTIEDNIRGMEPFRVYEQFKERFLRDWLSRFAGLSERELAELGPEELQRLITEHQRHQTTQLVKSGVRPLDTDMKDYLGLHDTLEGEFRNDAFWERANVAVKRGFNEWVLRIVQAVGMPQGQRYAFFQSQADPDTHLLVGLGLAGLPQPDEEPIHMIPYLKPFTRKAGYLLEIRQRSMGDEETYFNELRHYTLPFLFGFDQVSGLEVPRNLRDFFNTAY